MSESLIQRSFVSDDGRTLGCKALLLGKIMTVPKEIKHLPTFVPAAAVIQGVQALFGVNGRTGSVGGN